MRYIAFALACAMLAGCASSTPQYDARFGNAVRQAREAQTLNPNAGTALAPVGTDDRTARDAAERYHETYKSPPPVVNVINIGGAGNQR